MEILSNLVTNLQQRLFESVVSSNLVYNTCWEDPRADRKLLKLDKESEVVMLSSAGCNALDYLLDEPKVLHCVDINPAQNALLELKKALFKNNNYQLLWDFFGTGAKRGAEYLYQKKLRPQLSPFAQSYWDEHISYFVPNAMMPSFYFRGTSGGVARIIQHRIRRKDLYPKVLKMLNADSLAEQEYYFDEVEPQIWSSFSKWLVGRNATMAMLGVPANQRSMIEEKYQGGVLSYIRKSLRQVFTQQPLSDNYFWRVYLTGSYTKDCCPGYLQENHFSTIRNQNQKVTTYNSTLTNFLKKNPGSYSHFVLLDHQDWIAHVQPRALEEEWRQIISNAQKGAKILFRSAGSAIEYLPEFVFSSVEFDHSLAHNIHKQDRVGTYESTYLGIVK